MRLQKDISLSILVFILLLLGVVVDIYAADVVIGASTFFNDTFNRTTENPVSTNGWSDGSGVLGVSSRINNSALQLFDVSETNSAKASHILTGNATLYALEVIFANFSSGNHPFMVLDVGNYNYDFSWNGSFGVYYSGDYHAVCTGLAKNTNYRLIIKASGTNSLANLTVQYAGNLSTLCNEAVLTAYGGGGYNITIRTSQVGQGNVSVNWFLACNSSTPANCYTEVPTVSTASFVAPTPASGSTNGTQVTLNTTCSILPSNVTLWFDANTNPVYPVINNNITVNSSQVGATFLTNASLQKKYYFKASCDQGTTNSSVYEWTYNLTGNLDNCSVLPVRAINFSIRDENSGSLIATANVSGTVNHTSYPANSTSTYSSYSLETLNANNFSLCIPVSFSSQVDYDFVYSSLTGSAVYPQRRFQLLDDVLTNITFTRDLYLTDTSFGGYWRISVLNQYQEAISGAELQIYTNVNGESELVEVETSDSTGTAIFFININHDYILVVSKTGYTSLTATVRPVTTEIYTVTLSQGNVLNTSIFTGITYLFTPQVSSVDNGTTYSFTFSVNDTRGRLTSCGLSILNNVSSQAFVNGTLTSTVCSATKSTNTGTNTTLISVGSYTIDGIELNATKIYSIDYPEGEFSFKTLIDDISNFSDAGFSDSTRALIAFIIILSLTAAASTKFGSLSNPEPLILFVWALTAFFTFVGWLTLNLPYMPDYLGLPKWWIFFLVSIMSMSYVLWRHT